VTPARLAQIREHFRNPPSASCDRMLGLELCDALEGLLVPPPYVVVDMAALPLLNEHELTPGAVVIDDRPEPKKKAKK